MTASRRPAVSVVLGVHDGAETCMAAIASVLDQRFEDFELLVADDASLDDSWDVLLEARAMDDRVRLLRNDENVGYCRTYNRLIAESAGDVIVLMDQDDRCHPDRVGRQLEWLRADDAVGLVSCYVDLDLDPDITPAWQAYLRSWEDERRGLAGLPHLDRLQLYEPVTQGAEVAYRKALWQRVGGYRAILSWAGDGDLYLRIGEVAKVEIVPEVLHTRRVRASGMTLGRQRLVAYSSALATFDARLRRANIDVDGATITNLVTRLGADAASPEVVRRLLDPDPWSPWSDSRARRRRRVSDRIERLLAREAVAEEP